MDGIELCKDNSRNVVIVHIWKGINFETKHWLPLQSERERRAKKKCRQAAAATVEKLWNFVCCRACRIAAHTNKTHTHTYTDTHATLYCLPHTHTWQYWKLIWTLGSRQKTICKMKEKNSIDVDFPHVVIPLTLYSFPASDGFPSPLDLAHLTVVMKLPTLLQ